MEKGSMIWKMTRGVGEPEGKWVELEFKELMEEIEKESEYTVVLPTICDGAFVTVFMRDGLDNRMSVQSLTANEARQFAKVLRRVANEVDKMNICLALADEDEDERGGTQVDNGG